MARRGVLLLLGLAPVLATIPARANLGESVAQVVARYGKPNGYSEAGAKSPFGSLLFRAGAYELVIFLWNTTEVGARISKLDKSAFTDAERQSIMQSDLNGSSWIPVPSGDPACLKWTRADKATVLYDRENHILMFSSEEMAKAIRHPAPAAASTPPAPPPMVGPAPTGLTSPGSR